MRPSRTPIVALALLGCTPGAARDEAAAPATSASLELDLPAQLTMKIDGRPAELGTALPVEPGPHTIALGSPCGEILQEVEARAGEHTTLGRESFPTLALARLQVRATSSDGTPLPVDASLRGEADATWSTRDAEAWVPACPLRLTLASEGLGSFSEDVAFAPGGSYVVEAVLSAGPDVVRIHGGAFVSGPRATKLAAYRERDPSYANVERTVATFDLDRTEVTVAQYQACIDAGACVETPQELVKLSFPSPGVEDECNSSHVAVDQRTVARRTKPGRDDHPIDCVSMWEADRYCAWAGKRLPTSVEWEFAARSGKTEYAWPWGNDETSCRAHTSEWIDGTRLCPSRGETAPTCSHPEGNSEQGVCDLVGNVAEYVEFPPEDPRRGGYNTRGATTSVSLEVFDIGAERLATVDRAGAVRQRFVQMPQFGFRCARDVKEVAR